MRKRVLRITMVLAVVALLAGVATAEIDQSGAEELGWKLALQAWTNNQKTLFETLELAQRLEIHYVEAYPGQRLSPDFEGAMGPDMTDEQIGLLLGKMEECDVEIPVRRSVFKPAWEAMILAFTITREFTRRNPIPTRLKNPTSAPDMYA